MLLVNKVAIITGAGSGMGKASAELFAKEGASVVAADINLESAQKTASEIISKGGKAVAFKADISKGEEVEALVNATVNEYGKVNILFNIAGFPQPGKKIEDISVEEMEKVLDINVKGTWLCCKYAHTELKKSGNGVIINIGSTAAVRPRDGGSSYSASKGAIIALTKELASEFAPEVRVVCIHPGPTNTPMMRQFIPNYSDKEEQMVVDGTLLKKYVMPEDIAQMGLFLASDNASKITGSEFLVDSGLIMSRGSH
jgi:3-oxoacyl-[acyl-carrier protein] reductase